MYMNDCRNCGGLKPERSQRCRAFMDGGGTSARLLLAAGVHVAAVLYAGLRGTWRVAAAEDHCRQAQEAVQRLSAEVPLPEAEAVNSTCVKGEKEDPTLEEAVRLFWPHLAACALPVAVLGGVAGACCCGRRRQLPVPDRRRRPPPGRHGGGRLE